MIDPDVRAWFESVRGIKLRPEVTTISEGELDKAATSSRIDGRCFICWRSGRHDIAVHVRRWKTLCNGEIAHERYIVAERLAEVVDDADQAYVREVVSRLTPETIAILYKRFGAQQ